MGKLVKKPGEDPGTGLFIYLSELGKRLACSGRQTAHLPSFSVYANLELCAAVEPRAAVEFPEPVKGHRSPARVFVYR